MNLRVANGTASCQSGTDVWDCTRDQQQRPAGSSVSSSSPFAARTSRAPVSSPTYHLETSLLRATWFTSAAAVIIGSSSGYRIGAARASRHVNSISVCFSRRLRTTAFEAFREHDTALRFRLGLTPGEHLRLAATRFVMSWRARRSARRQKATCRA